MLELATLQYINSLHDKISLKKSCLAKNKVALWTSLFLESRKYCCGPKMFWLDNCTVIDRNSYNSKSTANLNFFLQVAAVHKITTECWHLYSISGQTFEIPADYLEEMSCCLYLVLKPIADQPLCSDSCHRFLLIHSEEISSFYMCINKKAYSFANKMLLSWFLWYHEPKIHSRMT